MPPPVESFLPKQLDDHLQYKPNGHRRKKPVKLEDCQLLELIQYNCDIDGPPHDKRSRVVCDPVLRLIRKCADGLNVEVTRYHGIYDGQK